MKKKLKLDVKSYASNLRGESVFFPTKNEQPQPDHAGEPLEEKRQEEVIAHSSFSEGAQKNHDTMTPRSHDTIIPRHHDTTNTFVEDDVLEIVRKAVKQIGKEAATHRFTFEEKQMLADIEYSHKRQGIKTSENEITRIAINYFVEDYKQNGENSILAKVLKRLNS